MHVLKHPSRTGTPHALHFTRSTARSLFFLQYWQYQYDSSISFRLRFLTVRMAAPPSSATGTSSELH